MEIKEKSEKYARLGCHDSGGRSDMRGSCEVSRKLRSMEEAELYGRSCAVSKKL